MASRSSADKLKPLPPDPDRHQHSAIPQEPVVDDVGGTVTPRRKARERGRDRRPSLSARSATKRRPPTMTRRPSTTPSRPSPGVSAIADGTANARPRRRASATSASAITWLEAWSREAAKLELQPFRLSAALFREVCFRDLGQPLVIECSPLPCCPRATALTASVRAAGAYGFARNRVPAGSSPEAGRIRPDPIRIRPRAIVRARSAQGQDRPARLACSRP